KKGFTPSISLCQSAARFRSDGVPPPGGEPKDAREEGRQEARREEDHPQAERRVHEADDAERGPRQGRRRKSDPPHGGGEEDLGLREEEQSPGQEGEAEHQRRRDPPRDLRREEDRLDVRDDEARQREPQGLAARSCEARTSGGARRSQGSAPSPLRRAFRRAPLVPAPAGISSYQSSA